MSRAKRAAVWTYVICRGQSSYGIETMRVIFRRLTKRDAADDVAQAIRDPYGDENRDYYMSRAKALRAATKGTTYYGHCTDRSTFEMHWQANLNGQTTDEWYGAGIGSADIGVDVSAAIARIVKRKEEHYDLSPADVLALLKAVPVEYCDGASEFVPCDPPDLSTTAQKRKQSTEAA